MFIILARKCGGFLYTMKAAALYAIRYTCAYKFYRTREIKSVVYGRNAENEPKNGRLP